MRNKAPDGAFKMIMQTRRQTRELLMKLFYQMDIRNEYETFEYESSLEEIKKENERAYFLEVIKSFIEHRDVIDEKIQHAIKSRDMKRVGRIELALIRVAATEMDYLKDFPVEVAVNEAIELSKIYATEKSYVFINGVLGRYIENKEQTNG